MSTGEWLQEHPKTDIAVGAVAATAAILARGRLSEAFMRGAQDVVKSGTIPLQEGLTAERIGNNLRIMAEDGFTVDVTKGLFGKYTVQAKLPDAIAMMTMKPHGVTVQSDDVFASLRNYSIAARIGGGPLIRRDSMTYGATTISKGHVTFTDRELSGDNFRLQVSSGHIQDFAWDTRQGTFGKHPLIEVTDKHKMTNVNGSLQLANGIFIRHDGIILQNDQKITPWKEFARRFEKPFRTT